MSTMRKCANCGALVLNDGSCIVCGGMPAQNAEGAAKDGPPIAEDHVWEKLPDGTLTLRKLQS